MRLVQSKSVNDTIALYRKQQQEIAQLKQDPTVPEGKIKELERTASANKKRLPGITFQATFEPSLSAKGRKGVWRKQAAAHLNGLYVCDFDHIDYPAQVYASWQMKYPDLIKDHFMMAFITASGRGLKVVAKASASRGNIIDNAHWLAAQLGLETDEACKDASRLSFCPSKNDLLFINNEIFTYENKEFEEKYGDMYRNNISASAGKCSNASADFSLSANRPNKNDRTHNKSLQDGSMETVGRDNSTQHWCADKNIKLEQDEEGQYTYKGARYADIIEYLAAQRGGWPSAGGRHLFTLQMASDLRYICDNDKEKLTAVLALCRSAQEIAQERGQGEIDNIVTAVTSHNMLNYMPKRLRNALESAGVRTNASANDAANGTYAKIDYAYWWSRLRPLLSTGFREAVAPLRDEIKLGGVLAAGAMFGTYLTKCWWNHYDGERRRLSYLVYIIGDAASGKSFIIDLDKSIMACMRYRDKIGRDWERQYKEDKARRATSRKDQAKEAQEIKHPVIRYVPSTISNAKFYQRSMDAVADVEGEEMHLHLYTMESELSTALRAQVGSWAGKLDLECKSFQNEYAGVDYANEQSVNGLIQVNWNQVISGTMDAMRRKIQPSTILDGLVTRLAVWLMPSNDFTMVERKHVSKDLSRDEALKAWGFRLDEIEGCLPCERLVDAAYKWCADKAEVAKFEDDKIMDYFRKRVPLYMIRYGVVRALLRQYDSFKKTGKLDIDDNDVAFAELIGDYILYMQQYMFGQQVEDAMDIQCRDFRPRKRKSKFIDIYAKLPVEFTTDNLIEAGYKDTSAKVLMSRMAAAGVIKKTGPKKCKKLLADISNISVY